MTAETADGNSNSHHHQAVLLEPVLRALLPADRPAPRRVLDGTFGRGGHSRALLARLPEDAVLYVIDRDPEAIAVAQQLAAQDARVRVLPGCFAELDSLLESALGAAPERVLDALLLDLGVSSPQLDTPERGFSLRFEGPLDMRMDPAMGQSAGQWLDQVEEGELIGVLRRFGEVRAAPRIARAIIAARPLTTTLELAEVIIAATPAAVRRQQGRMHLVTQCFQAIRIFINEELAQIETALPKAFAALAPAGRLAVISFHSLEDRLVKQFFRAQTRTPAVPRRLPIAAEQLPQAPARLIGKAQRASVAELKANPQGSQCHAAGVGALLMKALLLLAGLVLAVVLTGVRVAQTGYEVRMLNAELERLRLEYDAALNVQTQLQLERSAVASYTLTEATAQRQLSMIYPATMIDVRSSPLAEQQQ